MRALALALALAAFTLAAPAAAQDGSEPGGARTAESAQRFLAETLTGAKAPTVVLAKMVEGAYRPTVSGLTTDINFAVYGEVASWRVIDRCRSEVLLNNVTPLPSDLLPKGVRHDAPAQSLQYLFDWGRVTGTGASEHPFTVHVPQSSGPPTTRSLFSAGASNPLSADALPGFFVETADLAKRIAFAMQFLVDNCAVKSDTGF